MRIAVFGGSFNPPHNGHVEAACAARRHLDAEKLLVIPAAVPPHKSEAEGSPDARTRLELTRLAFAGCENTEVLDLELQRPGKSYTVDTLEELKRLYPEAELWLLMGTDMLLCFEKWKDYRRILELAALGVFPREHGDEAAISRAAEGLKSRCGARVELIPFVSTEVSSTELREMLQNRQGSELVPDAVYSEIIRRRLYGAKPQLSWLRGKSYAMLNEKRIPHVKGCEEEAVRLAKRWRADEQDAAEAGILHDITKKLNGEEQLKLCSYYDIMTDDDERANYKLLHSKTGAAYARAHFGVSDEVYSAIFWHTTGKKNMTLLEKIIYLADYIEPNRHFEGVEPLRKLAYEDLDAALELGLTMSLEDLANRGVAPHKFTAEAAEYYKR